MKRCGDETFRFEVRDTGIGFSLEQRAALFERFQQADDTITRRFGGTGLGLTISRELVEAMGGSIDCDASPGMGSTFWFELPLPTGASHAEASLEITEPLMTGRILVADDNRTNLRVVELILDAAGVATTAVEDGLEALETYRRANFDAVLMDMMMPRMDGLAATRAIRQLEAETGRSRTPLIMLTANALPEHIDMALAAGADLHLSKPITPATLLGALETVCRALDTGLPGKSSNLDVVGCGVG
ncbi:Sensory/regulatory protein RpfC [compost metagenome]